MGALSFFTRVFAPQESQVRINPGRCLRNRLRGNRCDLCLRVCPTTALQYAEGSLRIAEESCSNCMVCTSVCPVDALAPPCDLEQFAEQAAGMKRKTLTLSCGHNRLFCQDELLVPCLGIFSHELLILLSSTLLQKSVRFNFRECSGCRNEKAARRFQQNLKTVHLHSNAEATTKLELMAADSGVRPEKDRRSFFKAVQRSTLHGTASSPAGEHCRQSATSRNISSKSALIRKVLLSAGPAHPLAAKMVPRMHIDKKCEPCHRCAGICPTGALRMIRTGKERELVFDALSCCGCMLCVDFCKKDALALSCSL